LIIACFYKIRIFSTNVERINQFYKCRGEIINDALAIEHLLELFFDKKATCESAVLLRFNGVANAQIKIKERTFLF